jgi:hypothetical protein
MPRGNRVLITQPILKDGKDGEKIDSGYAVGAIYNMPPHMARKLVAAGFAEFYRAPKKA